MSVFNGVRITLNNGKDKDRVLAYATCKVCDAVFLTGMRVLKGIAGNFVSMPAKRAHDGEYQDLFFPASKAMRDELQRVILDAYERETGVAKRWEEY